MTILHLLCLLHPYKIHFNFHVIPHSCSFSNFTKEFEFSVLPKFWWYVATCYNENIVEFAIHSLADEETIEVEADKGTTLLEVCQNEAIDITGFHLRGVLTNSCLRRRWQLW